MGSGGAAGCWAAATPDALHQRSSLSSLNYASHTEPATLDAEEAFHAHLREHPPHHPMA